MIGKKRLVDVRTSLLAECEEARLDPMQWLSEQMDILERSGAAKDEEIATLKLIRDGLQPKSGRAKSIRKKARSRAAN